MLIFSEKEGVDDDEEEDEVTGREKAAVAG
jgi:hypothetical protein